MSPYALAAMARSSSVPVEKPISVLAAMAQSKLHKANLKTLNSLLEKNDGGSITADAIDELMQFQTSLSNYLGKLLKAQAKTTPLTVADLDANMIDLIKKFGHAKKDRSSLYFSALISTARYVESNIQLLLAFVFDDAKGDTPASSAGDPDALPALENKPPRTVVVAGRGVATPSSGRGTTLPEATGSPAKRSGRGPITDEELALLYQKYGDDML